MATKKKIKTVDCTPTWFEILPILTAAIKSKRATTQKLGYVELGRMAQAADSFNKIVSKSKKKMTYKEAAELYCEINGKKK